MLEISNFFVSLHGLRILVALNLKVVNVEPLPYLFNVLHKSTKMQEFWENIEGHEGSFQVSTFGRIKSLKRKGRKADMIMKFTLGLRGYMVVGMNRKVTPVHRIIAIAFIPNPNNKRDVNHKDGNKLNNRISNLEWCTHKENMEHAAKYGLMCRTNTPQKGKFGKLHWRSVRVGKYNKNGILIKEYDSLMDAQRDTNVNNSNILRACNGVTKLAGGFKWSKL